MECLKNARYGSDEVCPNSTEKGGKGRERRNSIERGEMGQGGRKTLLQFWSCQKQFDSCFSPEAQESCFAGLLQRVQVWRRRSNPGGGGGRETEDSGAKTTDNVAAGDRGK